MNKQTRDIWSDSNCEELIQFNTLFSCNRRLGWGFFDYWLSQRSKGRKNDGLECITSNKANKFCKFNNGTVDFSKSTVLSASREFSNGFLISHGQHHNEDPPLPGYKHIETASLNPKDIKDCTVWETRPTFVLSNDDVFNLSHYMNDVIMIWSMLILAGVSGYHLLTHSHTFSHTLMLYFYVIITILLLGQDSLLINMDGIRVGGPAGKPARGLVSAGNPDEHGPFSSYFVSWFNEMKKGVDYQQQRVCFKEIYFQYFPGYPWFWGDWSMDNSCSFRGPSPLYQSFSLHLRTNWIKKFGESSLPSPPTDVVHIVIELREINQHKRESIPRYILNSKELVEAIQLIPNVKVTVQSFSKIPFREQVALSHSAGIFISMHGAGTANMFHSAVGKPNCCALIELFPDTSSHFYTIRGFGNLARHYGMHYHRFQADQGKTTPKGTIVDITKFLDVVNLAIHQVKTKPSCLNNATAETVEEFLPSFASPLTKIP